MITHDHGSQPFSLLWNELVCRAACMEKYFGFAWYFTEKYRQISDFANGLVYHNIIVEKVNLKPYGTVKIGERHYSGTALRKSSQFLAFWAWFLAQKAIYSFFIFTCIKVSDLHLAGLPYSFIILHNLIQICNMLQEPLSPWTQANRN